MRIRSTRWAFALGCVTSFAVLGGVSLSGCSDDDSAPGPGTPGNDASTGHDANHADATGDGNPTTDGGTDGNTGGDAKPDTGDGGNPDAPYDPAAVAAFLQTLAAQQCTRLRDCCQATAQNWNQANCLTDNTAGFLGMAKYKDAIDAGSLIFDQTKANECLAAAANYPCGAWLASDQLIARDACFGAIRGTIPSTPYADAGAEGGADASPTPACKTELQCVDGWCAEKDDAGLGLCRPLKALDQPCSSHEECTYRGAPLTNAHRCDLGATSTCKAGRTNGSNCFDGVECASGLCAYNSSTQPPSVQCAASETQSDFPAPNGICDSYTN